MRTVVATRYVAPLREGGSLPAIVEADDDGLYVAKFRGAGQGLRALVAEVVAGELARALGLRVPELVVVEIAVQLGLAEPDPEIQQLVQASEGANLGVDFLPGALPYSPAAGLQPEAERAADVVWLDALTTNVDRSASNPNLLVWHGALWLIDHGAALYRAHEGLDPDTATRAFPQIRDHVLLPLAGSILDASARLADRAAAAIPGAVAAVPDGWLAPEERPVYAQWLANRLAAPRAFATEAEEARRGA